MNNEVKWITRRWQLGLALLAAGVIFGLGGIILERLAAGLPVNPKTITALGILFFGAGIGLVVRYGAGMRNPTLARRLASEERDERQQVLRGRAGLRAFLVSEALSYTLLLTVSSIGNGSGEFSSDALWYALVVLFLAPFGVYAASLAYEEKHS